MSNGTTRKVTLRSLDALGANAGVLGVSVWRDAAATPRCFQMMQLWLNSYDCPLAQLEIDRLFTFSVSNAFHAGKREAARKRGPACVHVEVKKVAIQASSTAGTSMLTICFD